MTENLHHNWLNDTARGLNGKIYQRRRSGPPLSTLTKWHEEFIKLGLDKQQSFYSYRQKKLKEWYGNRQLRLNKGKQTKKIKRERLETVIGKETVFIKGKYKGHRIDAVLDKDPAYCIWCLDNRPTGITSQQIIAFYNR